MSADGSANRSARARLRRLDSQALLPRCLGYRCSGHPSRQRRRARLPAKGTQRPPLEELNLVHRSASLRICGPLSSPALPQGLTQISALGSHLRRSVHTEFTPRSPACRGAGTGLPQPKVSAFRENAASAAKVRERAKLRRVPKRLAASQGAQDGGYAAFRVRRPISRMTKRR